MVQTNVIYCSEAKRTRRRHCNSEGREYVHQQKSGSYMQENKAEPTAKSKFSNSERLRSLRSRSRFFAAHIPLSHKHLGNIFFEPSISLPSTPLHASSTHQQHDYVVSISLHSNSRLFYLRLLTRPTFHLPIAHSLFSSCNTW